MDHFQEYLATEVALDHADGQLTRREALRRMGMMGVSLTAASALLAACGGDGAEETTSPGAQPSTTAAAATTTPPTTARPATTPVPHQDITYPGPNGTLMGAYAPAGAARGAVVVVHENRGLTDNIKAVASRLAGDGYSALAVDLLSEEGGTAKVPAAEVSAALNAAGPSRVRADLTATIDELLKRNPNAKVGLIGFCFGGAVAWDFLTVGEPRLAAAAPFYGTVPPDVSFERNKAAVFGVYGETDARVNATREAAKAALDRTTAPHEIKTYPGVGHGFYSRTETEQSQTAYSDVLNWFGRYLR
ncbi:MAG TPA: dienelactone hydrolase family protein [Acidimicrobiales bacterium]|nr:dienelactone hydrolase family protein [Acidimicrobiales bacterium]